MVSILPGESNWEKIGQAIGQNLGQSLPGATQQGFNRGQLQNSLASIRDAATKPNSSPLDITLAALQAGAGIPGSERYLGQIIPMLQSLASANAQQKTPYGTSGEEERDRTPVQVSQRPESPEFLGRSNEERSNFPSNRLANVGPGQVPQEATTGVKIPLLTPEQKRDRAVKLARERTAAGIPTKPQEALEEINAEQADVRLHNQSVDQELAQRRKGQQDFGQKALARLEEVYPGASPQLKAIFQKKGEDASLRGDSDAEIEEYLANEAKKIGNSIFNAKKSLSAPRLLQNLGRTFNGTYRDFSEAGADVKKHLQPLLDLGLYDEARNILKNDLGYAPEEREIILNPLSDRATSVFAQIPAAPKARKTLGLPTGNDTKAIKEGLLELKKVQPNFSPVLARKSFEDLNYDWKDFANAWNELLQEGFQLEDDQRNQQALLDTPPLSRLEKVLEGLNLIGR